MATSDVVLALLQPGPSHGYDLKRAHDLWFTQARPLAFGQVYATLTRLHRDGLVAVAQIEGGGGPERTVYELTAAGRDRLDAWMAEPVEATPPGGEELIRKTVAAVRLGLDPSGFLARQRAGHLRRMHALAEPAPDDPVSQLVRDHAMAHLDADLRWLDLAVARLTGSVQTQTRAPTREVDPAPSPPVDASHPEPRPRSPR